MNKTEIFMASIFIWGIALTAALVVIDSDIRGMHSVELAMSQNIGLLRNETIRQNNFMDTMVWAHNMEALSAFSSNDPIWDVTNSMVAKIGDAGNESFDVYTFKNCVDNISTIYVAHPNYNQTGVDGYALSLYDTDFRQIGEMVISRESADYGVFACGSIHYDLASDDIQYFKPENTTEAVQ